jgi:outer membrane protein insertion porin family
MSLPSSGVLCRKGASIVAGKSGKRISMAKTKLWLAFVLAAAIGFVPWTATRAQSGGTVTDIRVEGTERIEPATVLSYMAIRPGDPYNPVAVDDSLKSLFATGLFEDVTIDRSGNVLVVRVVENPIINEIAFEGNRRIDDEQLLAEVELRPRVVYTRTRAQSDTQRIVDLYRRGGRFAAKVEPKIIVLDQNRVNLVFEIDEGDRAGIDRITFVGNEAFSDGTLRDEIASNETEWWNILASNDSYDPDRLAFDQEQLRRFYLSEGYADFRVVSAVAELSPEGEGFFITFTIEEGERYKFGPIDIQSSLEGVDVEPLRSIVTTTEGDWYSAREVEQSITALQTALGDLQYAFVDIQPLVDRNRDERLIAITYQIAEGPRVFVERIDISGNLRTADKVIRREFQLVEGDPFNTTLLRQSETRIRNLGFFSNVTVTPVPGSTPDQTIIQTSITEQSTGDLVLGGGYSTTDGPLGNVTLRERNLLGNGQDLRISAQISGIQSEVDLSFTEPYFLDRDLAAGFDLFYVTSDNQSFSSYDIENAGFALRAGYPLSENLRQTVRYRFARRDVENIPDSASRFIRFSEGVTYTSAIQQGLIYDRLDSRIDPRDGYVATLTTEFAGLGGTSRYLKVLASADWYYPVWDDVILNVGVAGGSIYGLGTDVDLADRFFIGGDDFRGFANGGIGPRDTGKDSNNDALGAENYYLGTVELTFPLGLPTEFALKGRAFTDFGSAFGNPYDDKKGVVDSSALRASAGLGLTWGSPFGPIRIDYGFPFLKQEDDETQAFRFSFGTSF